MWLVALIDILLDDEQYSHYTAELCMECVLAVTAKTKDQAIAAIRAEAKTKVQIKGESEAFKLAAGAGEQREVVDEWCILREFLRYPEVQGYKMSAANNKVDAGIEQDWSSSRSPEGSFDVARSERLVLRLMQWIQNNGCYDRFRDIIELWPRFARVMYEANGCFALKEFEQAVVDLLRASIESGQYHQIGMRRDVQKVALYLIEFNLALLVEFLRCLSRR